MNLRAGPSAEYPLVFNLPTNTLLNVNGCLEDWSWCDVDWEGNRGWIYGDYLYTDWQNRRVPVFEYGASMGFGIVTFSVGDYWGRYYRGRPWYARERYWMHRQPPPRHPRPLPRPPITRPPGRPDAPGNGNRPARPDKPASRPAPDRRPPAADRRAPTQ